MKIEYKFFDYVFMLLLQMPVCWKSMYFIRRYKIENKDVVEEIKMVKSIYILIFNFFTFPIFYLLLLKNNGIVSTFNMIWRLREYSFTQCLLGIADGIKQGILIEYFWCTMISAGIILIAMFITWAILELVSPLEYDKKSKKKIS